MPPKSSKSLETVTNLSTTAPFTCTPPSAGLHDPSFTGPPQMEPRSPLWSPQIIHTSYPEPAGPEG